MLSPGIIWSTIFLYLMGMYMAALEVRKENGGYLEFKPALKQTFLVWVIANGIYHFYNYFLYNFLDTDMLNVQRLYMEENMEQMEGFLNEQQMELFKQGIQELNYNFSTVITTYFSSLIGGFIIAAAIARLVRRKPVFSDQEENTDR